MGMFSFALCGDEVVKGLMNVVVRLYIHYIYLMQGVERGGSGAFFKGISLSEYMKDMACPEEEPVYEDTLDDTNDLYIQCQPTQKRVSNFAIKEIDEDNYDETKENANLIVQPLHLYDLQRSRIIAPDEIRNKLKQPHRKPDYPRSKNQSISPPKQGSSPKKEMFRSLYGHSFGAEPKQQGGQLLSTLGMGNWLGRGRSLSKKQVELRDKNKRQYHELIKYENVISQRFDNKLNSIRIDGVKDKIHERSDKPTYKTKPDGKL